MTEVVKGGILVTTNGIKVFIPASMTSDRKVEDLNTLLDLLEQLPSSNQGGADL